MPLDSYSPCPGGRDKKIRHCCPDLTKELQQLETMMQNRQTAAVLSKIDALEKDHPNCACLMTMRCAALRLSGQMEAFVEAARRFHEAEPENMQAKAEWTLALAAGGDAVEALWTLIDGIEMTEPGKIFPALLLPAMAISSRLAEEDKIFPAVALAKLVQAYAPSNPDAAMLLREIYGRRDLPLLFKELSFDRKSPSDWLGTAKYNTAIQEMAAGQWKKARTILEELTEYADSWPNIWRSLALVRLWLCDELGGREAMERFAASENIDYDDAVDAETLCYFLREEADTIELYQLVQEIADDSAVLEAYLSSPLFVNVPFDPRSYGDAEHPAPNHIFQILDRPYPADDEKPNVANTPLALGTLLLYGRQTDRAARIEVRCSALDQDALKAVLAKTAPGQYQGEMESLMIGRLPWVASRLQPNFQFKPTAALDAPSVEALFREYLSTVFVPEWLERPSADFDGKTPVQAVKEGIAPAKLAGAVGMLGVLSDSKTAEFLTNAVSEKLNLPKPAVLSAPEGDEAATAYFNDLPAWRWCRVNPESFSSVVAGRLLPVARLLSETNAAEILAGKILAQEPADPASQPEAAVRQLAYEIEMERASMEAAPERTMELLKKASAEAAAAKISDGRLHLRELMLRLSTGDAEGFQRVLEHTAREHRNEPEIMEALQVTLMRLGILNPDGSPRAAGPGAMGQRGMGQGSMEQGGMGPGTVSPSMGAAGMGSLGGTSPEAAPKSSGLWTPGSDEPSGSGPSKLWTPD